MIYYKALMRELAFFISFFSISIGISGILLALLIYLREKNKLFLLYIFTVLMWTVSFSCEIFDYYFYYILKFTSIFDPGYQKMIKKIILIVIRQISSGTFYILYPILIYKLFNEKLSKLKLLLFIGNAILISIPALALIYTIDFFHFRNHFFAFYFIQVLLQLVVLYYLAFYILKKSKNIDDLFIKKTIQIFYIIMMIQYPFTMLKFFEIFPSVSKNFPYFGILTSSFFYFIINFIWLFFVSKFLHFPKIKIIDKKIDLDIFTSIYSVSPREKEIIESLINGLSYKEIGEKLFISFQTVKTHLKNIYKKVNVKNKMELSRLIRKCSN